MNAIVTEQNKACQIQRLAAQRRLYSKAKTILAWQLLVSGPLAVATAFVALSCPTIKGYVALWGMAVVIADLTWLTSWQKRLRDTAARIQETFDCDVLALPWNDVKAGRRPDPEVVKQQSDLYSKFAHRMAPLTDWYPREVAVLPLHLGRIVCQRSNCWWDSEQRKRYATWIIVIMVTLFAIVLVYGVYQGLTLETFLLSVLVPLSPALLLGMRHAIEHRDAATRLDKLKDHADKLWAEALSGAAAEHLMHAARNLQDEILDSRKRNPLVFDAVFGLLRRDYEAQMNYAASDLVRQAQSRLGPAGSGVS